MTGPVAKAMSLWRVLAVAVAVLVVPLALIAASGVRSGEFTVRLANPALWWGHWLYMVAPHLLALFVAVVVPSARRRFLAWALAALSVALVAFQCWVWWWVPVRESGLAWVLYIPLSAGVLVSAAAGAWLRQRLESSFRPTPNGAVPAKPSLPMQRWEIIERAVLLALAAGLLGWSGWLFLVRPSVERVAGGAGLLLFVFWALWAGAL